MVNHRTRKKDKTRCLCLTLGLALLFGCTERSLTEKEGENGVVRSKLQEEELSAKPSYGQSADVVWVVMKEKANLQNVKTVKGWVPRTKLVYDTLKRVADSSYAYPDRIPPLQPLYIRGENI